MNIGPSTFDLLNRPGGLYQQPINYLQILPVDRNEKKRLLLIKLYNEGRININEFITLVWDLLPLQLNGGWMTTTTTPVNVPDWTWRPTTVSYSIGNTTFTSIANKLI